MSINRIVDGESMGMRLFVGNINFSLGDADLRDAFAEVGEVERAEIVRDRFDGRSRGFGFVEMSTEDAAALALRELNGRELAGRPLRVEAATSQRRPFERNAARA
jgi:RNA recognition motif-containing protein